MGNLFKDHYIALFKKILLNYMTYEKAEALKTFISCILYYTGLAYLISHFLRPGASILIYHSISERGVFSDNQIKPEQFEKQIKFLVRNYKIVPLSLLVEYIKKNKRVPSDWVILTFDDGYQDNLVDVVPILQKHGVVGTFFITIDVVKNKKPFFYDEIEYIIDSTIKKQITIDIEGVVKKFCLRNQSQKNDAVLRMVLAIRKKNEYLKNQFVKKLRNICGDSPTKFSVDKIYLSEDGVRKIYESGMEIGSHTIRHLALSYLSDSDLHSEIVISKMILEKICGASVLAFSYPFGKKNTYNNYVKKNVKDSGYSVAVTTQFGKVNVNSDIYALPRIGARKGSLNRLKVNLMGIPI